MPPLWTRLRRVSGVSRLHLKAFRDLFASFWQFFACGFIVVLGTASYVAVYSSYLDLYRSVYSSYDRLHFADFSVRLQSAPRSVVSHVEQLPGVGRVIARVSKEVELRQISGDRRKLIGRIIGLPDRGRPEVNDVVVVDGTYLHPGEKQEVLLESAFARYHGYHPGDMIYTEDPGGHRERFRIVGLVRSPEYIWVVRDREYLMPSPSTFGVMFMAEEEAARVSGLGGRINDIQVTMDDASRLNLAMREARLLLDGYGAEEPVPRSKQPSNELLQQDLGGFQKMAVYFPSLFLSLAALTIVSLLNRIILSQRPQIGILMALGCSRFEVARHYLSFAGLLGIGGAVGGCLLGRWLGFGSTRLYTSALGVPYVEVSEHPQVLLVGSLVGLLVPLISGYLATRKVMGIEPAAALYSEVSTRGRQPWLEKLFPALSKLQFFWKLPLRNLFRKPGRTLYTSMGVALAISQVMMTMALMDSRNSAIDMFFDKILMYNLRVVFLQPRSDSVVQEVRRWPGVLTAEATLEIPVKMKRGDVTYSTLLFGVETDTRMVNLYDRDLTRIAPEGEGMLVGPAIERKLSVEPGQSLDVAVPRRNGRDAERFVPLRISRVMRQPIGSAVYLPIDQVRRSFGASENFPPRAINSITILSKAADVPGIQEHCYRLPGAAAVERIDLIKKEITDLLKMFNAYIYTMVMFAAGLAFAIIFNSITLGILERTREIATMRTLGRSNWSIVAMITTENLILWVLGMLAGLPLGRVLAAWFVSIYQTDFASFVLTITPSTLTLLSSTLGS